MRVLSADQPHPQLMVTRQPPRDLGERTQERMHRLSIPAGSDDPSVQALGAPALHEVDPLSMVKRIHTASYPFPYIGERVAIYATKRKPDDFEIGPYSFDHQFGWDTTRGEGALIPWMRFNNDGSVPGPSFWTIPLPLGAIVGSVTVEACVPILGPRVGITLNESEALRMIGAVVADHHGHAVYFRPGIDPDELCVDVSDQLSYSDFSPGMHAWILEEAAPTTERCPWCWGRGWTDHDNGIHSVKCPHCECASFCPPISWAHPGGRHPEWTAP